MSYSNSYNVFDRLLHHFVFSTPFLQQALSDLESDLFRKRISETPLDRQVFIAGLPRAGTNLLLEILHSTGEFAAFTYRDMPFVLSPIFWKALSRPFQKVSREEERAHGDGMMISFDSPEAFEEIIWLSFLKDTIVTDDRLATLTSKDVPPEQSDMIKIAIQKLLFTRARTPNRCPRYLSKNNNNLSRIEVIRKIFPSSMVLIPFRDPLAQISSLGRQHNQFKNRHSQDKFSKEYMKWIGHFDFGENFKPINFNGWLDNRKIPSIINADFWLEYWMAAYSFALKHKSENVIFFDFDKFLKDPPSQLSSLARALNLRHEGSLFRSNHSIHPKPAKPTNPEHLMNELVEKSKSLHIQLQTIAI